MLWMGPVLPRSISEDRLPALCGRYWMLCGTFDDAFGAARRCSPLQQEATDSNGELHMILYDEKRKRKQKSWE